MQCLKAKSLLAKCSDEKPTLLNCSLISDVRKNKLGSMEPSYSLDKKAVLHFYNPLPKLLSKLTDEVAQHIKKYKSTIEWKL